MLMWPTRSARVSTLVLYTSPFSHPHKQKSKRGKSGERAGLWIRLPRPIHRLGYVLFRCWITYLVLWIGAPSHQHCLCPYKGPPSLAMACNTQYPATRSQVHCGGIFENLLWDMPDVDKPGFCPLHIINNTMVSTCMHMILVVMFFIT